MTPSFFQRNRSGELMALASNDIQAVSNTAGFGVLTLVNTVVITSVVMVSMIVFVSFKLMIAALLPLPLLALAISVWANPCATASLLPRNLSVK